MFSSLRGRSSSSNPQDEAILAEFPDEPIPLVQINDDESFSVNESALNILRKIEAKISIVAVAGLYRTGKSSLLNWLMNKQAGFTVGPTVQRCTRGIWIWGRPRIGKLASGEECWCVLLDTEGIGGLEADAQYDARIFSLATLLCSTLVYNSLGSIDENAISSLSFIANLTQHIRISSDSAAPTSAEEEALQFHQFFPAFNWIIRDFALDLVDEDGERLTTNEYLENSLKTQPGFDKATTERNRIRHMLTSFFQERNCTTLVRPINDERALQKIDEVPYNKLRKEFRQALEELKKQLFEQLKPKALSGRDLNGAMFAGLTEAYVQAINEGGVPTISSAWEGVSKQECRDSSDTAFNKFRDALATYFGGSSLDRLPVDEKDLMAGYKSACEAGLALYNQRCVGDEAQKYREQLQEKMQEELERLSTSNDTASEQACDGLLQTIFGETLHSKIHGGEENGMGLSVESVGQEFEVLQRKYLGSAVGPAVHRTLASFLLNRWPEAATALQQRQAAAHEAELRKKEEEVAEARGALATAEAQLQSTKQRLQDIEKDLSATKADKINIETQLQAQTERLDEATKNLRLAEIEVEGLKEENEGQNGVIQQQRNDFQRQKEAFEAERNHLNQQLRELAEAGDSKDRALKDAEEAFSRKLEEQMVAHKNILEESKAEAAQKMKEAHSEITLLKLANDKKEQELLKQVEKTEHGASEKVKELSAHFEEKLAQTEETHIIKEKEYKAALEAAHLDLDKIREEMQNALDEAAKTLQALKEEHSDEISGLQDFHKKRLEDTVLGFEGRSQQLLEEIQDIKNELASREESLSEANSKMIEVLEQLEESKEQRDILDQSLKTQQEHFENMENQYQSNFEEAAELTSVREQSLKSNIESLQQSMNQLSEEAENRIKMLIEESDAKIEEMTVKLKKKDAELEKLQAEHQMQLGEVTATAGMEEARLLENILLANEEVEQWKDAFSRMISQQKQLSDQYTTNINSQMLENSRLVECNGLSKEETDQLKMQVNKQAKEIFNLQNVILNLREDLNEECEINDIRKEEMLQVNTNLSILKDIVNEERCRYSECMGMMEEEKNHYKRSVVVKEQHISVCDLKIGRLEEDLQLLREEFSEKESDLEKLHHQATSSAEEREKELLVQMTDLRKYLKQESRRLEELLSMASEEIAHWKTTAHQLTVNKIEMQSKHQMMEDKISALTESLQLSAEEVLQLNGKVSLTTQWTRELSESVGMALEDRVSLKTQLGDLKCLAKQQSALMMHQIQCKDMTIEDLRSDLFNIKEKHLNELSDTSVSAQNIKQEFDSYRQAASEEASQMQKKLEAMQELAETKDKQMESIKGLAVQEISALRIRMQVLNEESQQKDKEIDIVNSKLWEHKFSLEAYLSQTRKSTRMAKSAASKEEHEEVSASHQDSLQEIFDVKVEAFVVQAVANAKEQEYLSVVKTAANENSALKQKVQELQETIDKKEDEFRCKQEELVEGIKSTAIELDTLKSDFDEQFFKTCSSAAEKESEQSEALLMAEEEIVQLRIHVALLRLESEQQQTSMNELAKDLEERELDMVNRMQEAATMLEELTAKYEEQKTELSLNATKKESELLDAIKAAALELDDCQMSFERRETELQQQLQHKEVRLQEVLSRTEQAMKQRKKFFEENQHHLLSLSKMDSARLNEEIEETTRLLQSLENESQVEGDVSSLSPQVQPRPQREVKLQEAYDAAQQELVGLRCELDRWRSEMEQATVKKEEELSQAKELAAQEIEALRANYKAWEAALTSEAEARQAGLAEAQADLEEMRGRFEAQKWQLTEMAAQREKEMEEAHVTATKKLNELEIQYQDKLQLSLDSELPSKYIENLKEEYEKQQSELVANAASREAELQQEVEMCQDQLKHLTGEYEKNVAELSDKLKQREEELATVNAQSSQELTKLRSKFEEEMSEAQQAATAREADLIEALAKLKAQYDEQKGSMDDALKTEKELEEARDALQEELAELRERVKNNKAAEEEELQFQQEMMAALKEIEAELSEEISVAREKLQDWQRQLDEVIANRDLTAWQRAQKELELHEEVEAAEEYIRYLESNLEAKRNEMSAPSHRTHKDLWAAKEAAHKKLEDLKQEHEKREKELHGRMEEMKKQYDLEIKMVKDHMAGTKRLSHEEHQRLAQFWDCLEDPQYILKQEVDQLRAQIEGRQSAGADTADGEGVVGHLKRVRGERKKYKDEVRRLRIEIKTLAKDFEEKLLTADEMLTDAQRVIESKTTEVSLLISEKEELQGELKHQQQRFVELAADIKMIQIQGTPQASKLNLRIEETLASDSSDLEDALNEEEGWGVAEEKSWESAVVDGSDVKEYSKELSDQKNPKEKDQQQDAEKDELEELKNSGETSQCATH